MSSVGSNKRSFVQQTVKRIVCLELILPLLGISMARSSGDVTGDWCNNVHLVTITIPCQKGCVLKAKLKGPYLHSETNEVVLLLV